MAEVTERAEAPSDAGPTDQSLAELFGTLSSDFSELVHDEIALAKAELKQEVGEVGKGGGLLGGGALAAVMASVFGSFAAAWALEGVLPIGIGFVVVAAVWALAGAALALRGKRTLEEVDPVPHQTLDTMQEDVQWAKDLRS